MPTVLVPPPLVPGKLRELLADFPEYVGLLQQAIDKAVAEPSPSATRIELIVWGLEDCLDGFIFSAKDELNVAKAGGDTAAIAKAEAKELLMHRAWLKQAGCVTQGSLAILRRIENCPDERPSASLRLG